MLLSLMSYPAVVACFMTDIPLYKIPGPRLVLIVVGLFFLALFSGGFYWDKYMLPGMLGPWVIETPGKYLVMLAFLLFAIVAIGSATPLSKYSKVITTLLYAGLFSFALGGLVLA